eukprot:GFUD01041799.1.p1 GENE.GFUD01041799.1~~GFUD01041799.1.p1  ORF type:complete len:226 (+),score=14.56 GFUD01041799.1:66-743(+)
MYSATILVLLTSCLPYVAPLNGWKCMCENKGLWPCGGVSQQCIAIWKCPADCFSRDCCERGGGDCGGYQGQGSVLLGSAKEVTEVEVISEEYQPTRTPAPPSTGPVLGSAKEVTEVEVISEEDEATRTFCHKGVIELHQKIINAINARSEETSAELHHPDSCDNFWNKIVCAASLTVTIVSCTALTPMPWLLPICVAGFIGTGNECHPCIMNVLCFFGLFCPNEE